MKSAKNATKVYFTVFNPRSRDELERLLAKAQRRKAATKIASAARQRAAKKKAAWARVSRIIEQAEAQFAASSKPKRKYMR